MRLQRAARLRRPLSRTAHHPCRPHFITFRPWLCSHLLPLQQRLQLHLIHPRPWRNLLRCLVGNTFDTSGSLVFVLSVNLWRQPWGMALKPDLSSLCSDLMVFDFPSHFTRQLRALSSSLSTLCLSKVWARSCCCYSLHLLLEWRDHQHGWAIALLYFLERFPKDL